LEPREIIKSQEWGKAGEKGLLTARKGAGGDSQHQKSKNTALFTPRLSKVLGSAGKK